MDIDKLVLRYIEMLDKRNELSKEKVVVLKNFMVESDFLKDDIEWKDIKNYIVLDEVEVVIDLENGGFVIDEEYFISLEWLNRINLEMDLKGKDYIYNIDNEGYKIVLNKEDVKELYRVWKIR